MLTKTTSHIDEISKHKRVNVDRIMNITYLHEFDRSVCIAAYRYIFAQRLNICFSFVMQGASGASLGIPDRNSILP